MAAVYSADVRIWATAYVVADSEKEARALIRARLGDCIEVEGEDFSGVQLDALPEGEVLFSPTMTVDKRQRPTVEFADDWAGDRDDDQGEAA